MGALIIPTFTENFWGVTNNRFGVINGLSIPDARDSLASAFIISHAEISGLTTGVTGTELARVIACAGFFSIALLTLADEFFGIADKVGVTLFISVAERSGETVDGEAAADEAHLVVSAVPMLGAFTEGALVCAGIARIQIGRALNIEFTDLSGALKDSAVKTHVAVFSLTTGEFTFLGAVVTFALLVLVTAESVGKQAWMIIVTS